MTSGPGGSLSKYGLQVLPTFIIAGAKLICASGPSTFVAVEEEVGIADDSCVRVGVFGGGISVRGEPLTEELVDGAGAVSSRCSWI